MTHMCKIDDVPEEIKNAVAERARGQFRRNRW